jgi:nitrite reductase/ring-hydroxylating ferredoxin subunit
MTNNHYKEWTTDSVESFLQHGNGDWLPVCSLEYIQTNRFCEITFPAILPRDESAIQPSTRPLIQGRKKATLFMRNPLKRDSIVSFNSICPHTGQAFMDFNVPCPVHDIESMSVVRCNHHGWTFDLLSGACIYNKYVIDVFSVRIQEYQSKDWVWISRFVVNEDIPGPRKDYQTQN